MTEIDVIEAGKDTPDKLLSMLDDIAEFHGKTIEYLVDWYQIFSELMQNRNVSVPPSLKRYFLVLSKTYRTFVDHLKIIYISITESEFSQQKATAFLSTANMLRIAILDFLASMKSSIQVFGTIPISLIKGDNYAQKCRRLS